MHPVITIFCAFTRPWAVDLWLENLAAVEHDPALTNLCIIVDGDHHVIANTIKKFAEQHNYRSFHMKINEDWRANEVQLGIRRMRVADVKNQSRSLITKTDADIIICFEDDTVFDRLKSFEPLYKPLDDPKVGFVEGVQMGRWGAKIIGAWQADDVFEPKQIKTLLPPENTFAVDHMGYADITAGGFYGYATRRELYLNHEYYTSSAQPWGPDVNYGLWLRQRDYRCLIDWSLLFGHHDYSIIAYPDKPPKGERLVQVVYTKDRTTGKWNREDHESSRY